MTDDERSDHRGLLDDIERDRQAQERADIADAEWDYRSQSYER